MPVFRVTNDRYKSSVEIFWCSAGVAGTKATASVMSGTRLTSAAGEADKLLGT